MYKILASVFAASFAAGNLYAANITHAEHTKHAHDLCKHLEGHLKDHHSSNADYHKAQAVVALHAATAAMTEELANQTGAENSTK